MAFFLLSDFSDSLWSLRGNKKKIVGLFIRLHNEMSLDCIDC